MYGFELAPAPDKVECSPRLDFVGITFDCRAQELSIRLEKRAKAHATAARLLACARWFRKDVQSYAGHLAHFGRILRPLNAVAARAIRFFILIRDLAFS